MRVRFFAALSAAAMLAISTNAVQLAKADEEPLMLAQKTTVIETPQPPHQKVVYKERKPKTVHVRQPQDPKGTKALQHAKKQALKARQYHNKIVKRTKETMTEDADSDEETDDEAAPIVQDLEPEVVVIQPGQQQQACYQSTCYGGGAYTKDVPPCQTRQPVLETDTGINGLVIRQQPQCTSPCVQRAPQVCYGNSCAQPTKQVLIEHVYHHYDPHDPRHHHVRVHHPGTLVRTPNGVIERKHTFHHHPHRPHHPPVQKHTLKATPPIDPFKVIGSVQQDVISGPGQRILVPIPRPDVVSSALDFNAPFNANRQVIFDDRWAAEAETNQLLRAQGRI